MTPESNPTEIIGLKPGSFLTQREYVDQQGMLCPVCQGSNLRTSEEGLQETTGFRNVACHDPHCGYSWTEAFVLSGYENLEDGEHNTVFLPDREDLTAEDGARLLVQAYRRGGERGDSVDWNDVDQAYVAARKVLGLPESDQEVECKFCHEDFFDYAMTPHRDGLVCPDCWDDRLRTTG